MLVKLDLPLGLPNKFTTNPVGEKPQKGGSNFLKLSFTIFHPLFSFWYSNLAIPGCFEQPPTSYTDTTSTAIMGMENLVECLIFQAFSVQLKSYKILQLIPSYISISNINLASPGALTHCLQHSTTCFIQNGSIVARDIHKGLK